MSFRKRSTLLLIFLSVFWLRIDGGVKGNRAVPQLKTSPIAVISADELKSKLARNQPVAIIDVRATSNYVESPTKIKGAVHVKLRRLKYRLGFSPLKDIPKNREVVTYCACPADEAALAAAQILLDSGFTNVRALKGGWQEWLKVSGQVESLPKN
jgi:rhodanese-related sulfurtransferase